MSDEVKNILREKGYDFENKTDEQMMLDRAFWEAIIPNPKSMIGNSQRWAWWAMNYLQGSLWAGSNEVVELLNIRVKNNMHQHENTQSKS